MLTRQGWGAVLSAVALVVAGRLFGIVELYVVAVGVTAVLIAGAIAVELAKVRLDVARSLHPRRVHAGTPSRVDLQVRNPTSRPSPLVSLADPIDHDHVARVVLAPLDAGKVVTAAYQLPTERRGIRRIGPLSLVVSDPFGLVRLETEVASATELTVWPRIDDVLPLPPAPGDALLTGTGHVDLHTSVGDEFSTLRTYVPGDDLRRVHWPTSARRGELMIRQDEMPWERQATIVLDVRRDAYSAASFERAVSAAASVVSACAAHRAQIRVVTTARFDSGSATSAAHVEAILEHLATVPLANTADLPSTLALLGTTGHGGAVAVMLGGTAPADIDAAARLRLTFPTVLTVAFTDDPSDPPAAARMVTVGPDVGFGEVWDRLVQGGPVPVARV